MIPRPPRSTLFLHDALPILVQIKEHLRLEWLVFTTCHIRNGTSLIWDRGVQSLPAGSGRNGMLPGWCCASPLRSRSSGDRKSTRLNASHSQISYAVFFLIYK